MMLARKDITSGDILDLSSHNRETQNAAYARITDAFISYFKMRTGDDHLAHDLAQETVCNIYRGGNLSSYDPSQEKPMKILVTIARRRLIDYWRRMGRAVRGGNRDHLDLLSDEFLVDPHDYETDRSNRDSQATQHLELMLALARPGIEREIVYGAYVLGLGNHAVSEIAAISPDRVRIIKNHFMKRVRKRINNGTSVSSQ